MKIKIKSDEFKILRNDGRDVKYVVHLSDIHIRKSSRFNEYRQVFRRLFDQLKNLKLNNTNSVIVVTGDIIHDKSFLTGGSVDLLKDFFLGLSSISTTLCIIGNHDINLNSNSLDSISPVIGKAFNTKYPVHVLLDDCVYEYNNIQFGVTTLFASKVTPCKNNGKINIGLYHGIIDGSITDLNLKMTNTNYFKVTDFKKYYNFSLLGDIHKHQYLDKEKTIWYAGSLIQQNRGENLDEHGFEILNLQTIKSKFHKVKNDYGKVEIIINDDGTTNIDEIVELPKNMDIKIICRAKDRTLVDRVYTELEKNNIILTDKSCIIDYSDYNINMQMNGGDSKNLLELRDKESILNLFSL